MAAETYSTFWRKALAIGILPFAALGVAGCDNTETAEEDTTADEEVIEEDPTAAPASEETMGGEEEDTMGDEEVVEEDGEEDAG